MYMSDMSWPEQASREQTWDSGSSEMSGTVRCPGDRQESECRMGV